MHKTFRGGVAPTKWTVNSDDHLQAIYKWPKKEPHEWIIQTPTTWFDQQQKRFCGLVTKDVVFSFFLSAHMTCGISGKRFTKSVHVNLQTTAFSVFWCMICWSEENHVSHSQISLHRVSGQCCPQPMGPAPEESWGVCSRVLCTILLWPRI